MRNEFLMPTKYEGENVGISIVVVGLVDGCEYKSISISIGDETKEVVRDGDKTTSATFDNLIENMFYTVRATIMVDDETFTTECRVVPNVKINEQVVNVYRSKGVKFNDAKVSFQI